MVLHTITGIHQGYLFFSARNPCRRPICKHYQASGLLPITVCTSPSQLQSCFMDVKQRLHVFDNTEKRIQLFMNQCQRKLIQLSHREHKANHFVGSLVATLTGQQDPFICSSKMSQPVLFSHGTHCKTLRLSLKVPQKEVYVKVIRRTSLQI